MAVPMERYSLSQTGRAGDELVDGIFKYLDPLISEKLKEISSVYKNFFVEPQE